MKDDLTENNVKELMGLGYQEDELDPYPVSRDLFSPRVNSDVATITEKVDYPELSSLF